MTWGHLHRLLDILPYAVQWLLDSGLKALPPWIFLDSSANGEELQKLRQEFITETAAPNPVLIKDMLPFARRDDCDDFAGFVIDGIEITRTVVEVHLTFTSHPPEPAGFPQMNVFHDLWDWLARSVVPTMALVAKQSKIDPLNR